MEPSECILYETSHCHLCEQAQAVLMPFVQHGVCTVELVDIVEDDQLLAAFGECIPVLYHVASRQQLNWPFDQPEVQDFLQRCQPQ